MTLLREIRRLADDVVAAVLNLCDKSSTFLISNNTNPVAYSHRVCATYTFQAEIALYLAVYQLSVIGLYGVPAAGVLYY